MISRRALLQSAALVPFLPTALNAAIVKGASALNDVPAAQRPRIRFWWPGGAIEPLEVAREVDVLADAGFGGFEIADVRDSITVPMDPKIYGWGGARWRAGVESALEQAVQRGIKVDLTIGAHWPTAIPGVMPNDPAASKELVYGEAKVAAGGQYRGPSPPPLQASPSGEIQGVNDHLPITPRLVALQAFRVVRGGAATELDFASRIDLTPEVRGNSISWTAPAAGDWRLIAFWARGTGQIQNMFNMNRSASMLSDPKPYVVDIYGKAGTRAVVEYWETHLLTPKIRSLVRELGSSLFEDSLEMSAACYWTPELLAEFERRRGYSLVPYLALLPTTKVGFSEMFMGREPPAVYLLSGVDRSRVLDDFNRTLNEMYDENRVGAISDWAHSLGMKFRAQVTGSNINSGLAVTYPDIPEGDNSNDVHGWRRFAAGRDVSGKRILSDEAGTFVGGNANVATWRDLLYMLQRDYAGGVKQAVIHGFSYATAPGAEWPGFSAFGRAIGNDWGPRDPNWAVADDVTAYLGRVQHFLQSGVQKSDIAILGSALHSSALLRAGYTWEYPVEELLHRPEMVVREGVLAPGGPSYRALVINRVEGLDAPSAARLVEYARGGLPILMVGSPPSRARTWHDAPAQDRLVREQVEALLAQPSVRRVAAPSGVAGALQNMRVPPCLGFSAAERILGVHRREGADDLYYLLNDDDRSTTQTVRLEGGGTLYRIDPWSGKVHLVTDAQREGRTIAFPLTLAKDEVALFRISPESASSTPLRVIPHRSALLSSWTLDVEDWQPGGTVTAIRKVHHHLTLSQLRPWSAIPELQQVSGVGRYRTTLHLAGARASSYWIDLGRVGGTPRLIVNGTVVPVNLFSLITDISDLVHSGANTIEIVVATPLNNRLRAIGSEPKFGPPPSAQGGPPPAPPAAPAPSDPDEEDGPRGVAGMQPGAGPPGTKRTQQDYGLFGPVRLLSS